LLRPGGRGGCPLRMRSWPMSARSCQQACQQRSQPGPGSGGERPVTAAVSRRSSGAALSHSAIRRASQTRAVPGDRFSGHCPREVATGYTQESITAVNWNRPFEQRAAL
jgi:hypothetical protein